MCGIAGLFGGGWTRRELDTMVAHQRHRGPDGQGRYIDSSGQALLGHDRLSIIDLSEAGSQPMTSADGRLVVAFNGEIYNYLELRAELSRYPFRSHSDTEVVLAAFERWGDACLHRFIGMFALMIWNTHEQRLFAARDRFGVKPFFYHARKDGALAIASEISALRAAGLAAGPDPVSWATYLSRGLHEYSDRTFWQGVHALPAGYSLKWHRGGMTTARWYDLAGATGDSFDERSDRQAENEYLDLLQESVRLRFRAEVPVGINLSGGVDSSALLGLVHAVQGQESDVLAFTFTTNDERYDELPWVRRMLEHTNHRLVTCQLTPEQVPKLAASVQAHQDEPFGGIPTLAYARIFEEAKERGITVLLDGQGMDEQHAGYDYYRDRRSSSDATIVQGSLSSPVRPHCLRPEFAGLADSFEPPRPFPDTLRNLQYRDALFTKMPRALRFNDRISMRSSTELREPFLDHRLFELALRQPEVRKLNEQNGKVMLRKIASRFGPAGLMEAPKRPIQTPQREWLRGPLSTWAEECICNAAAVAGGEWVDRDRALADWYCFKAGDGDNSFFVWQWINLGLASVSWD